jgi:MYXO-CTERM domain-containing protein
MSPPFQTFAALVLVALAAAWLVRRSLAKKKQPGCGSDCGCASSEVKAAAAKIARP